MSGFDLGEPRLTITIQNRQQKVRGKGRRQRGNRGMAGFHLGSMSGVWGPLSLRAGPGWCHRGDQVGSHLSAKVASGESGPPASINKPLGVWEGQRPTHDIHRPFPFPEEVFEEGCSMERL